MSASGRGAQPLEIQASMNHPLAGAEPNLLAYWKFDEGAGSSAFDATGTRLQRSPCQWSELDRIHRGAASDDWATALSFDRQRMITWCHQLCSARPRMKLP